MTIKKIWTIGRREFKSYFSSPLAYLILAGFLLVMSWMFFNGLRYYVLENAKYNSNALGARGMTITDGVVRPLYGNMNVIFLLMLPMLTMRLFAEEKKQHTLELLLTSPIRLWELVLGKFFSAMAFVKVMILATIAYPLVLAVSGSPDWGPIVCSIIGTGLFAAWYLSLGALFSSLTENAIIAASLTFLTGLFFWLIPWAAQAVGPVLGDVLTYLSPINHFNNFTRGLLDTADLAFYVLFTAANLFLTERVLDSYRWR